MDTTDIPSPTVHDEEPFEYNPISVNNGIRLVKLLPATFHEPIACTLFDTKLHGNLSYEALSYTWGNHQNLVSIKVNGKSFGITHNLATAIRYLRKEHEVTMWIDAICINQHDDDERTQQVALMTNIYQRARQVQIWLGPAADNSEMVMELFEKFVEKPSMLVNESLFEPDSTSARSIGWARFFLGRLISWARCGLYWPVKALFTKGPQPTKLIDERSSRNIQWLKQYLMEKERVRFRRALEALLEREYWSRAWIVQEILMASEISLSCGSSSVPWKFFTTMVEAFVEERSFRLHELSSMLRKLSFRLHSLSSRQPVRRHNHSPSMTTSSTPEQKTVSAGTIGMKSPTLAIIGHLVSFRLVDSSLRGPHWLLEMLLNLRHFKSKDPRDKIFSLLGLINKRLFPLNLSKTPILSVDYSLTFLEVSTRLFKYYALAPRRFELGEMPENTYHSSLNILSASQPTNRPEGFPSWLPDFSRNNGMEHWPRFGKTQCAIFKGFGPMDFPCDSVLGVYGVVVTSLEQGYVTDRRDDPEATDDLCLVTRIWNFMLLAERWCPSALATVNFWATLQLGKNDGKSIENCLCSNFGDEEPNTKDPNSLLRILEQGIRERNRVVASFLDNFRRGSLHRRFAMMRIGRELRPAMVPADARPGDILHLLRDFDYPALLRPVDDRSCNFEFVGPCCIPEWCADEDSSHYGPIKKIMLQ